MDDNATNPRAMPSDCPTRDLLLPGVQEVGPGSLSTPGANAPTFPRLARTVAVGAASGSVPDEPDSPTVSNSMDTVCGPTDTTSAMPRGLVILRSG